MDIRWQHIRFAIRNAFQEPGDCTPISTSFDQLQICTFVAERARVADDWRSLALAR
jgi:hypothetical protein